MKPSFLRWLWAAGLLAPLGVATCYEEPAPSGPVFDTGGTGGTGEPEEGAGGGVTGGAGGAGGAGGGAGSLVINELVINPAGDDAGCFIEIKGTPGTPLAGRGLRAVDGEGGAIYAEFRFTEAHALDANGYFVVAQDAAVVLPQNAAFVIDPIANLQDGPDTIILTAPGGVAIDAVSYSDEQGKFDPPNPLGEGQFALQPSGLNLLDSLSRLPDGNDTGNNATDFAFGEPTPGAANVAATGVGGGGGAGGIGGAAGNAGAAGFGGVGGLGGFGGLGGI
ncbi:MAG TPA: lamin tail domain-containing protein [Polyangiaceae bacterium]|nr:lamin tail domain-containing protein [Polyangiaceae bacterium]